MPNHCFTPDLSFFSLKDSERPESFFRRLLWKNSGVLCLVTLVTLPIILGVAIGYLIILAFVTSYRKITGKKSREEKEIEAAKKIRIVLGHDLLDTAFTKPEELPGQKPRFVRPLPRYGSVNDSIISSDGSESESETETEDDSIDQLDERNLTENRSENKDLHNKMEACVDVEALEQSRSQSFSGQRSRDDVTNDVTDSDVIDNADSRTTSASSGHYSTASEMVESDGRDSTGVAILYPPGENTRNYDVHERDNKLDKTPAKTTTGNKPLNKSAPDVAEATVNESGFFEESVSAVHSLKEVSDLLTDKTAPMKHCGTLSNQAQTDQKALAKQSRILDSSIQAVKTVSTVNSVYKDSGSRKNTAISNDCSPVKQRSGHLEIPPSVGKLKYTVYYMREKNELQVTIIKAINLFHVKSERSPSSFVKVSLLPQRFCWQKTKIIEETQHPVFNETFVISGFSHERFSNYTLLISVVNAVTSMQGFYGDHVIGELYVPLSHVAKYSSNQEKVFSQWAELKPKIAEIPNITKRGKINLALCYRPISGRLIVTVKKAKELECDSKEKFESHVKLALYCGGARVGRGTTRVKRKVTSPVFNEKFNFDLSADQIAYTTIVVKVMNKIDSTKSSCAGATVIGYESSGNGQEHWLCMMKCLSKHVDAWHNLYN